MVGTGRFELPTPRTPSECSTRLSHVPTRFSRPGKSRLWGLDSVYTRGMETRLSSSPPPVSSHGNPAAGPARKRLVRRRHKFAGQRRTAAEEELIHLLHQ